MCIVCRVKGEEIALESQNHHIRRDEIGATLYRSQISPRRHNCVVMDVSKCRPTVLEVNKSGW